MASDFILQFCCLLVVCVLYAFGNQDALSDTYIGCYDDTAAEAIFKNKLEMMNLTPEACRTRCNTDNNRYIGLWGGINCWCSQLDIETHVKVVRLDDSSCSSRCVGNRSLFCGGPTDKSIYSVYSVCPKATYGPECTKPCNCKDNSSCTVRGVCPNFDCADGWRLNMNNNTNKRQCTVDIDECERECSAVNKTNCHNCSLNEECRNTKGSFECKCTKGYNKKLRGVCQDIDECRQNTTNNCSQICLNTEGSYSCSCSAGYQLKGLYDCEDVDECADGTSNCSHYCNNTVGSYLCSCRAGYRVDTTDQHKCIDIDECNEKTSGCDHICQNNNGNYTCSCEEGYEINATDRHKCNDIDECASNPSLCEHNCHNTYGNYSCSCRTGYRPGSGDRHKCYDIDECIENTSGCDHNCLNTDGNYTCSCGEGYEINVTDRHKCNDINECKMNSSICSQECENTPGTYNCHCRTGYELQSDKYTCNVSEDYTGVILTVIIISLIVAILVMVFVLLKYKRMFPFNKPRFSDTVAKKEPDEMPFENGTKELTVLRETKLLPNSLPTEKTPLVSVEAQPKPVRNTCVAVKDLKRYIEKIEAADGFEEEFREIPMVSEISYEFSQTQGLKPKNRFKNILPYDNNRVSLDEINEDPLTTYINASFIKGYSKSDKIIASHGPTSNTLDDFWRMIWKYDVTVIVMVTKCMEDGKRKCEQYWPLEGSMENCGSTISVVSTEKWPDYIITYLKVSKDNTSRRIVHLLFTDWPDHGVPDHATSLLSFRRAARNVIVKDKYFLVHCSAGVGRTGTFLAIDFLLQQAKHKGSIDVYKYLQALRDERMNVIQTLDQYEFIHRALLEALTLGETVIPCSSLSDHLKHLNNINPLTGKTFIQTEFDMLQEMHPPHSAEASSVAVYQNNISRNRDSRIIPGDANRVFLTTETSGISDYINAVFVSNYRRKDAFISTELPLPETLNEFWLMTLNYKCKLVVFLDTSGNLEDIINYLLIPQKTKLFINQHKFWTASFEPKALSDFCSSYSVAVSVASDDEDIYANFGETPAFSILILHFQLSAKLTTVAQLLPQIHEQIKTSAGSLKDNGPVVIISRDGVNPTGQFIAVSNLLEMASCQHEVDVFNAVHNIKRTQPHFITALEEYQMIYDALEAEGDTSTYANF